MEQYFTHIGLDEPANYRIILQGKVERDLSDWFLGEIQYAYGLGEPGNDGFQDPITEISGVITDQAGLHGLLIFIRDMGIPLLFVDCLSARVDPGN